MARLHAGITHISGIPLGGLGTGSVEIRPDGYFHEWQIFNLGRWAPRQPEFCRGEGPDLPLQALSFFIRTQAPGAMPAVRRLGLRAEQHDLYSFAWLKSVEAIEYTGRYPVATLRYVDGSLPVTVSARMFSPFTPHDARTSGTPGFHATFRIRNLAGVPVSVSLLGVLQNPLAWGAEDRALTNTVTASGGTTYLTMRTAAQMACPATVGSLGLSVSGGEHSHLTGFFPRETGGFTWHPSAYGIVDESWLHHFRQAGQLPDSTGEVNPAHLLPLTDQELEEMPDAGRRELLEQILCYPFSRLVWERVGEVDPDSLETEAGRLAFLKEMRGRLDVLAGRDRSGQEWGDGALCSTVDLGPLEEREVRFTLGWHFPHHFSANGPELGHMYEHWFADAEAVNRFLAEGYQQQAANTIAFSEALFDTNLDPDLADAWAGQLSTLAKCTWWTRDGKFAVWEGLGCCGFHTTDITYQGSFSILALFPELQQGQMEMGAAHQREDGRVHHFFTPDLSAVDDGFDRVDMNQQFVLLVCRDYLWTGDREYLQRMWPHIVRAMDNTAALDADGDALPDHDTRRNTYDAWNFFGTPSYIASLWLGALRAGVRLAQDLGEQAQAQRWQDLLDRGRANFERKLWNGEYYSLWVDGDRRDECCMTDQVDGEWFTSLIGLGPSLPRERVVQALQAIVRYNFNPEDGLVNANYPPGTRVRLTTYRNLQATAPWTGIEYAIASCMYDFGLVAEATAVVKNIHARYLRAGRFWNHVECGDHYYRAMSSWAILLGVTGFKVDVPRQTLTIAPAVHLVELRAPWVSATGWGRFVQSDDHFALHCDAGQVTFRELRLNVRPAGPFTLAGRSVPAEVTAEGDLTVFRFAEQVTVREGETLEG